MYPAHGRFMAMATRGHGRGRNCSIWIHLSVESHFETLFPLVCTIFARHIPQIPFEWSITLSCNAVRSVAFFLPLSVACNGVNKIAKWPGRWARPNDKGAKVTTNQHGRTPLMENLSPPEERASEQGSRGDFYQRHFIKITNGTGNSQRGGAHSQHHKATCVHFLLRAP